MKAILPLPLLLMIVVQLAQECVLLLVVQDVQTNVQINVLVVLGLVPELVLADVQEVVVGDVLVLAKEIATDIVLVVAGMTDAVLIVNQLDVEEMDVGKIVFMIVLLVVGRDIN